MFRTTTERWNQSIRLSTGPRGTTLSRQLFHGYVHRKGDDHAVALGVERRLPVVWEAVLLKVSTGLAAGLHRFAPTPAAGEQFAAGHAQVSLGYAGSGHVNRQRISHGRQ